MLGLVRATAACEADEGGLGPAADRTRRISGGAGEVVVQPVSPAPAPMADPGNATVIIRAQKLTARRIVARLIFAEKIEAESSAVADLRKDDGKLWQTEGASGDLSFDELRADTIYSKEIRTGQLEAAQVFVKDLTLAQDEGDEGEGGEGEGKGKGKGTDKDKDKDKDDD